MNFIYFVKLLIHRAVENAFIFTRKTDNYGKLYSVIPNLAKWFPQMSDYNAGREAAIELYKFFKVILIDLQLKIEN